ncbi:MAG: hypothetical protein AAGA68_18400 [Pseudomonadota bacterium]
MAYRIDDNPCLLCRGNRVYNYGRMGARPDEVLLWRSRNRVIVKVNASGDDPRDVAQFDRLVAELTALTVARTVWRSRFGGAEICAYLVYDGPVHVAVDVDLVALRATVDHYLATSRAEDPKSVPVHVVAYALLQRTLCSPELSHARRAVQSFETTSCDRLPEGRRP